MADRLVGWLYGRQVVTLTPAREFRVGLEWHEAGIERWGRGSRILSAALPLGSSAGPRDLRGLDFFENLLPEGAALATMAAWARVPVADTLGILAAFGRDCAGAIVLVPEGERPPASEDGGYVPMTAASLEQLLGTLGTAPLGAAPDRGFRPSLAGFQRKALLGRAADGTWQRPVEGAPSTWILKPDGPHAMAANESTCLRLAAACGLGVPRTELLNIGGLPVLAVERYDRMDAPAGPVRIHQEDGCQATARPQARKYEDYGGPSLKDLVTVIRDFGNPLDVADLLRRTTFNMAVGNADAHAKNFSILHDVDDPAVRLAPLYDVLSTISLELTDDVGRPMRADTHLGQRVGHQNDIRNVTRGDLADEAARWGLRRQAAAGIVADVLDRVLSAIPGACGDERVLGVIREQAERVAGSPGR